jgi:putative salt-induced outer membrane protein YdiY
LKRNFISKSQEVFVRKKFVVGLLLLLAIPALADQIVLKNGDKLTGSITKSDGKVLVISTEWAGDVTVKFDAIQSITSAGDLNVTLGGKTVVGPVTTDGDNVVVTTKSAGPVEAPKASVSLVRSPAQQAAYEKSLHPGLLEGWNGGLNLGFALTAGNSETKNLNIGFTGVRTGFHDKLALYVNTVYAVNDKITPTQPTSVTTANSTGGGARYDHDFTPRTFGFVSGDFFTNSLQNLDLRSILGGGFGLHVIKHPNTTLDLLAGLNYTHESYSDVSNPNAPPATYSPSYSTANLSFGDAFTHKIGKSTVVTQSFLIYPGLTETTFMLPGDLRESDRIYRGSFNLGSVTKINKWLAWQIALGDVFVSKTPPVLPGTPAIERNDLQISTGVSFTFTH